MHMLQLALSISLMVLQPGAHCFTALVLNDNFYGKTRQYMFQKIPRVAKLAAQRVRQNKYTGWDK